MLVGTRAQDLTPALLLPRDSVDRALARTDKSAAGEEGSGTRGPHNI